MRKSTAGAIAGVAVTLVLTSCASATDPQSDVTDGAPGEGTTAIGFITVGPKDDFGYNQAVFEGSEAVKKAYPDMEILTAENVPEDDTAATTMEKMIDKGAKLIFATSYGHLDAALKVAEAHPDVVVVQQGNTITTDVPKNSGTYFGTVYEPMYLAGIAAGSATKTDKLGYVYAFPIPQTIANINAFEQGALSVNPDAETITVSTSDWCNPGKQQAAAESLLSQDVDVLTQHQDCTATVIQAAEKAGAMTVGYHADASSIAPEGWLTGAVWNWGPLYTDIVKTVVDGDFVGSEYNANFRVGYKTGTNPFVLAGYGDQISEATQKAITEAQAWLATDEGSPFAGPVEDQSGKVVIKDGAIPTYAENDGMGFFVKGVIGKLAQ
ncbi:BMP family ABC transporter substrate-binding protein [Nocardioides cavernaquae]|nr:BMP family ABC transporter substrate-binding protein [Nocardioides cavernaquae]